MQAVGARTGVVVIALTMLVCLVAVAGREPLRGTPAEPPEPPRRPAEVVVPPPSVFPVPGALPPEVFVLEEEDESATPAWLLWMIVTVALAGILAAGVAVVREVRNTRGGRRRRRPRSRRTEREAAVAAGAEHEKATARSAVDAALAPLRDPADARSAVIEAYARMEQVLAEREFGRRSPEAPREYLRRVLLERGMPEQSLTTVTALFEEARFSLHPIPDSAPRRALRELENARVALGAPDERD